MKLGFWRRTGRIMSIGMYSGRREQGLFREYVLHLRKDPFQGKEDAIYSLIKKFFPKEEWNKVKSSIKRRQSLYFETSELTCSFEDGLHKLGLVFEGERDEANTRIVFITTSKHYKEGYYCDYTEVYVCPKCDDLLPMMYPEVKSLWDAENEAYRQIHLKCDTECRSLYDMNPKELKNVEKEKRTIADLINNADSVEFVVDDAA